MEGVTRLKGETTREATYRRGLEWVKSRLVSTCTYDPLKLEDIVTQALQEGVQDDDE